MLSINTVSFGFSSDKLTVQNLKFEVKKGEFVSVLGESGSGKSTLLKLIYGLEDLDSGEIIFENEKVTGPKFNLIPGHPDMKFVPQEFDLLDYVTVAENVGKYLSNFNLPVKNETIEQALNVVGLLEYKDELPTKLSGGQRQRISIARAIAARPKLLLLDEPYSHLDQPLKFEIRKSIHNWAKNSGCTVILTTHDIQDALAYSDQIIILKEGKIIQNDTPEMLRNRPVNEYVASLLGEYSILNADEMNKLFQIEILSGTKAIIYPEEVLESEEGADFKVIDIRYQGRDFLIEVANGEVRLKFYSDSEPIKEQVKLLLDNWRFI